MYLSIVNKDRLQLAYKFSEGPKVSREADFSDVFAPPLMAEMMTGTDSFHLSMVEDTLAAPEKSHKRQPG